MSVTTMKATAAIIVALRNRLNNQERLDNPISETDAWTLFQDSKTRIDTRRLAAHRLLDIAIEHEDSKLINRVAKLLKCRDDVCCLGLVERIKKQRLHAEWRNWAFIQVKRLRKVPADVALAA